MKKIIALAFGLVLAAASHADVFGSKGFFNNGSGSVTIPNGTVTNAKLANEAANSFKCNNTGSATAPIDCTVAQALALIASTSGGGTVKFLNASGAWTIPAGAGTVTSVGLSIPGIFTITNSPVTGSGTLTATPAGTSGGVPYFSSATSLASSGALTANAVVLGGGAGAAPTALGSLGTTTTVLHGNAAGAPTFGAVDATVDITGLAASATTDATNATNISSGTLADGRLSANVPLINGANAFTANQKISDTEPRILLNDSDQGTDLKLVDIDLNAGVFSIRTRTDADGAGTVIFSATRSTTTTLSNITIGPTAGGNPTYTLGGAGTLTSGGGMQLGSNAFLNVGRLQLSGTTAPTIGLYTATSTATAIASSAPLVDVGTKFTAAGSGCTVGATVGGHSAGTFTLATGPCTSVVVTMNGATGSTSLNGWSCQAHDRTAPTVLIGGESSSTATTATFTIPAGAGTSDVISYNCTGY